jgi:hypothetical protein
MARDAVGLGRGAVGARTSSLGASRTSLAGTRQETQRSVAEHVNDHLACRNERCFTRPRQARLRARRLDRIVGRVRVRDRGEIPLAQKKAAKRRRRENKEAREKAKAERTGPSPAQQAEAVRNVEAEDPRQAERRTGLDGSVGGDTASNSRPSQ